MTLLGDVLGTLRRRGVSHALVGGMAMASHGVARATLDTDVLVVDRAVLDRDLWESEIPADASAEVRIGDADDPLAGLVRIVRGGDVVDIVVGRGAWQRDMLARAYELASEDGPIPVVELADLVLLKLYAGGPQDLLDIDLMLADADDSVCALIETRVGSTPKSVQQSWHTRQRRR